MDKIEKIRQEIERRKSLLTQHSRLTYSLILETFIKEYDDLLSFLDTLEESERPEPYNLVYDEAYLNEKIKKATESWKGVDVDAMLAECRGYDEEKSEEPDKNLEEEVKNYFQGYWPGTETAEQCNTDLHFTPLAILRLARHFAEWQKEQFEKNRLAHCDAMSKEDYDRETDFAMEIIEKEHRQPTFTDAINYGMRLQAEKDKDTIELAEEHAYFAGAVNERDQMLKEAVEGFIFQSEDYYPKELIARYDGELKHGDKVRIIVLPKED